MVHRYLRTTHPPLLSEDEQCKTFANSSLQLFSTSTLEVPKLFQVPLNSFTQVSLPLHNLILDIYSRLSFSLRSSFPSHLKQIYFLSTIFSTLPRLYQPSTLFLAKIIEKFGETVLWTIFWEMISDKSYWSYLNEVITNHEESTSLHELNQM